MYTGLTDNEVVESRKKYGSNSIPRKKRDSFLKLLLNTLGDPIIKILLIALAVKIVFLFRSFNWYETIGIVISILLASFISSISEYGSASAFEKLQSELLLTKCKVIRNNKEVEIDVNDIVVGDIICLTSGDRIPADGIVVKGSITVDESSLNGETKEIYKEACLSVNNCKKNNEVYKGSVVYSNSAYIKVTKVGQDTFYGKIALELQTSQPTTPLKRRLESLAKFISKIGYIGALLVFMSYLFKVIVINNNFDISLIMSTVSNIPKLLGYILYALTLSVTVIIVAVPEGLPMMITLVLSSNMKKMIKDNVLVRKMMGIETSGNINVLFTDKTGTLTKGKLEVVKVVDGCFNEYNSEAELIKNQNYYNTLKESCIVNNESVYSNNGVIGGNITDRAILAFFKNDNKKYVKKDFKPFNSNTKYSSCVYNNKILIKGAPEVLINKCINYYNSDGILKKIDTTKVDKMINKYTKQGMRVILVADSLTNSTKLNLIGFLLIKDDIRNDAREGVEIVKRAGIKIVMITGDNKDTAIAIGKEVGIYSDNDTVLTSEELNKMTDEELKRKLNNITIIARSLPSDKSRLVRVCQEMNLVVGMTGDGVNDAPALKHADVGFSMGSGTEVAKEASDIVILDDNFLSISKAVLYGRTIFKSLRKFIILQLTINMCALFLSIIGPFIGIEMPITVIQMLWINMVMDTLAGLSFSFEPPLKEYMNESPKKIEEPIINRYMLNQIFVTGLYSSALCILFLKFPIIKNLFRSNNNLYTAFFGLFIFMDIFTAFNARTHRLNILSNIFRNKVFVVIMSFIVLIQIILIYYGGDLFRTSGLSVKELFVMLIFSFSVIPFDMLRKIVLKKYNKNTGV